MPTDDVPAVIWGQCTVCATEVPLDQAIVPEPTDRLVHFCGLDCYARWRAAALLSFPSFSDTGQGHGSRERRRRTRQGSQG